MAENKTKPTDVSVADFLAAIPDAFPARGGRCSGPDDAQSNQKTAQMWGPSIVGFGSYHYVYESGREGDMPVIGFSPRKPAHVLYVRAGSGRLDTLLPKLGKLPRRGRTASTSRSSRTWI